MFLSESQIAEFRVGVMAQYRAAGRDFPWRRTSDPWLILTSEVMLQQTRTETVLARWDAWTGRFPDPESLAGASLQDVLRLWKGLGYNRRALALKNAALQILGRFGGWVPREERELRSLPGVGPYTARAVRAFAFGEPGVVLETNIRAVYLFYFFPDREKVPDREIEPYVEATLVPDDPRTWYYALMDYGAALKLREPNPCRKSATYTRQSKYEGSHRQVRAAILHMLADRGGTSVLSLKRAVAAALAREASDGADGDSPLERSVEKAIAELSREGFLDVVEGEARLKG